MTQESEETIAGTLAVFDYKQGVRSIASAAEEVGNQGYEWAYIEIKTCSTQGSVLASTAPGRPYRCLTTAVNARGNPRWILGHTPERVFATTSL